MSGLLELPGFPKPTTCVAYGAHRPRPLRFVWHHVLPLECGGQTSIDNLVQVCDSCHYAIHAILYHLHTHGVINLSKHGTVGQRNIAWQGFERALALGTDHAIPNEGGLVW